MSQLDRCLLMFSGGRDSTLAAARLADRGREMSLVTLSSDHLRGVDRVRARVHELASVLPPGTPWLRLRQPDELRTDVSFYERTCLPCHHAYVVAAVAVAALHGATSLAFGYASYQSSWPEQSPMAIQSLEAVLARHGIALSLPVLDLASRSEAISELAARGLNTASLEQKCLRQVDNVRLDDDRLRQQVSLWEAAMEGSLSRLGEVRVEILERSTVGDLA